MNAIDEIMSSVLVDSSLIEWFMETIASINTDVIIMGCTNFVTCDAV